MTYYNHGTWLQWIYAGSLLKTMPETHQGQLLAYPWLRWDWEKCQEQCDLGVQTTGEEWHNRVHPQVNSSRRGILSGFPPIGSAPIPPTLHSRSETQLRNRSGGLYSNTREQTPPLTWQWYHQSKRGALSSIQCWLWLPQHRSYLLSGG